MSTSLDPTLATELAEQVSGPVLAPDDEGNDRARALYNGFIDRGPAVIVRCLWGAKNTVLPANRPFRAMRTEFWHPHRPGGPPRSPGSETRGGGRDGTRLAWL